MIPVGEHGLTCLDGEDYAAIPLLLESNARAIDEALSGSLDSFSTYNDRPWAIGTSGSALAIGNILNEWQGPPTQFQAISIMSNVTWVGSGFTPGFWPNVTPSLPSGWYMIGGSANFAATGVVNANTRRDLVAEWRTFTSAASVYEYAVNSVFESNTAGDAANIMGMFFADGSHTYTPDIMLAHRNTSSTLSLTLQRMWIFYMGSGEVL